MIEIYHPSSIESLFRQILYQSQSTAPPGQTDVDAILRQSKNNNALDGVSGLLSFDGTRFLQVFEGPPASVALTWARILNDPRHAEISVIQDIATDLREFGYWSMALVEFETDETRAKIQRPLIGASPSVRQKFLHLTGHKK